jgi:hypothetical protein
MVTVEREITIDWLKNKYLAFTMESFLKMKQGKLYKFLIT